MIKKAIFIIFISALPLFNVIGCSEDNDDSSSKSFYIPDRYNTKCAPDAFREYDLVTKEYDIAGQPSASGTNVNAIVYHGSPKDTTYFAIALDNRHATRPAPPTFSVRIFFAYGGSISDAGTDIDVPAGSYTIQVVQGGSVYTETDDNLHITVTDETPPDDPYDPCDPVYLTYRVDFEEQIVLTSGPTISAGDYVIAQKFPN